jgi:CheY-like chemotaxis protein
VIEANSGYRALEVLKGRAEVDIVVADHAMPGMTGFRLAREIRTAWPDLPVLIASGFVDLTDAEALDLPILTKPYDQKTLTAKVRELLAKRPHPGK